jgi:hypothetical protein
MALWASLALTGCGGGDDAPASPAPIAGTPSPAPAAPAPAPAAPAPTTTVTGSVVKGPVAGAQVCAYTVVANGRGSALGSCTTSDAQGRYSFAVPAGTGPLWVEATGGTYTDEATGAVATLPAGSTLRSIVTANAGTVTTMLTPLTTLALNSAIANLGTAGQLNAATFSAAAAQLLSSFNLPATLNLTDTTPTFGTGINSYGTALTVTIADGGQWHHAGQPAGQHQPAGAGRGLRGRRHAAGPAHHASGHGQRRRYGQRQRHQHRRG